MRLLKGVLWRWDVTSGLWREPRGDRDPRYQFYCPRGWELSLLEVIGNRTHLVYILR